VLFVNNYIYIYIDFCAPHPTTSLRPYTLTTNMPTTYNVRSTPARHARGIAIVNDEQVTLKPEASPEELQNAKKEVESKGGKITHEFSLIKGFTYASPLHTELAATMCQSC
jgi:hypothetical protein